MPTDVPSLPLPPPLTSDEPGTWAYDTMSRRVRVDILARIFRENTLLPQAVKNLEALDAELANGAECPLSLLSTDGGPDIQTWNKHILPQVVNKGLTWLSSPWLISEFYMYRRIMSAIDYFNNPVDPFTLQKELGLSSAVDSINVLSVRVNSLCASTTTDVEQRLTQLQTVVLTALWGNRMDLSIWPVGGGNDQTVSQSSEKRATEAFSSVIEAGQQMILSNDMESLTTYFRSLLQSSPARMDIIVDNAGFELFCDLCLADFLICAGFASVVYIQLKAHPTFVSDAMEKDVHHTVKFLCSSLGENGSKTEQSRLGDRWATHIAQGKWKLTEDFFWVQPPPMWDMPQELRSDISESKLVFVKGDANYRRLLGDLHWEFDTPFSKVVSYFPAPVCALRTLKAELGCGMPKSVTQKIASEDPKWLVAGKYGVVQFCDTRFI